VSVFASVFNGVVETTTSPADVSLVQKPKADVKSPNADNIIAWIQSESPNVVSQMYNQFQLKSINLNNNQNTKSTSSSDNNEFNVCKNVKPYKPRKETHIR
jgi:hypothetical protein